MGSEINLEIDRLYIEHKPCFIGPLQLTFIFTYEITRLSQTVRGTTESHFYQEVSGRFGTTVIYSFMHWLISTTVAAYINSPLNYALEVS
jgi:hypothetical protein